MRGGSRHPLYSPAELVYRFNAAGRHFGRSLLHVSGATYRMTTTRGVAAGRSIAIDYTEVLRRAATMERRLGL